MSDLKAKLIEVAVGILETEGPGAVSLRSLARKAGVSHMAPYRHFESKNALLAAVAAEGFRDLVSAIDAAVAGEEVDALKSRAVGIAYIDFARRRPALFRLMFGPQFAGETQFPELADAVNMARARSFQAVALLQPQAGQGGSDTARPLGIAIWSLVHGLANLLIDGRLELPDDRNARDELIRQVLDVLGTAVAAGGDGDTRE